MLWDLKKTETYSRTTFICSQHKNKFSQVILFWVVNLRNLFLIELHRLIKKVFFYVFLKYLSELVKNIEKSKSHFCFEELPK